MTRQSANFEILNHLYRLVLDYPELRFSQILRNANLIKEKRVKGKPAHWENEFNVESEVLLKRMNCE